MDPFLGQIIFFAGNYAPRNWALMLRTIITYIPI